MSLSKYAALLSRQKLFSQLQRHELELLSSSAIKINLKKGGLLIQQGASTDAFYVVLSGRAAIIKHDDTGREVILNQVAENDYIGELHVVNGEPHSADVRALTKMDVLRLERQALLIVALNNPKLVLSMLSGLAMRLRLSDERVRSLAHETVSQRLLQVIQSFPNQKLSTIYLAKSVGCSRETAGRVLNDLQSKGELSLTAQGWKTIVN